MGVLTMLGLAPGERVGVTVVPAAGVERARRELAAHGRRQHLGSDGRTYVAEQLAEEVGGEHDLVLLAVPAGRGTDLVEALSVEVRRGR